MSNPYQPPNSPQYPQYPQYPPNPSEGDSTGGVIPYKNMPALLAYYLGIASLICCLVAIPFGIVPVVLGIVGLQKRAANPAIKGSVHAWIGIVLGGLNFLLSIVIWVIVLLGQATQR
ncbi:MAG: DUF4190 domain-containing protein [Pirellulaceae bacterium]|jgi:hypothetical protein|nr:DUF4190 domain-containing protein [Pirellulaceae bacterium]